MRSLHRLIVFFALATPLAMSSCFGERTDSVAHSDDSFAKLGAVRTYLDFPHNRATLDRCFAENNSRCLKLLAEARKAVRNLFEHGREAALQNTFDGIAHHCRAPVADWQRKDWTSPWQLCVGAIASFYFFSTDAEDRKILTFLSTLDDALRWNAFVSSEGFGGDWTQNRPDRQRWMQFVDSLTILDRDRVGREGYKNVFAGSPIKDSRMALLDPGLSLTEAQQRMLEKAVN